MLVDADIVPTAVEYMDALSWGAPAICLLLMLRFFSEGSGFTRPTMYMGLLGVLLNVPLNYVLMFGKLGFPEMGARGCGYCHFNRDLGAIADDVFICPLACAF